MAKPKTAVEAVAQVDYVPSKREAAALQRFDKRRAERRRFPKLIATSDDKGSAHVSADHADQFVAEVLQHEALGILETGEFNAIVKGVFNFTTLRDGKLDGIGANEAFQLIAGMEPRNTTEALLATQMAAVHLATMDAARRLHRTATDAESLNCTTKALNGLARTFAVQAEVMKKLKGGGQQKVVVEHKHYYLAPGAISHNSQAILGDVSQGRGTNGNLGQPHEPETSLSERTTVHGHLEANGMPLPSAGSDWMEGMPVSWGEGRSPERVS